MTQWLPSALFALFSFGLWGFFSKLAIHFIDSKTAFLYQTIGVALTACLILSTTSLKLDVSMKGLTFGILTGLAYGIGCLFYFIAVTKGKLITVVTLTALYPLVTILLSTLILKETINAKQWLGICLALIAIYLLA